MEDILSKVVITLLTVPIPLVILLGRGPARHNSWWYPNPDRSDYPFKLWLYAMMDIGFLKDPIGRWFVRGIAFVLLVVPLIFTWIWQPDK